MGIVIRKAITTAIVNYAGVALGVINILWLQTAIFTKLQIGIVNYLFDVAILLFPFIMFGTSGLPARFLHHFKSGKEQNSFISLLFTVPLLVLLLVSGIFVLFQEQIIAVLGEDAVRNREYLIYIIPIIFCYIYQYALEAILTTKSLTVFTAFFKTIVRRLIFIGLLIAYHFQIIAFADLVFWFVVYHFIEIIIVFIYFKTQFDFSFATPKLIASTQQKKEIYQYALYLLIGVSGVVMVGKIDSVMISGITDDLGQLGIYTIAFFIATVIELPKRIVHQLAFPIMSKNVTENKQDELNEMYQQTGINMALISLFLFLLIWYNIDELFLLIPNGEIYQAGKWAVFFVGIAKVLDAIFGTTDLMINATKHFKWNGFLVPILIALTLLSNYIFINLYGIVGAAIATSISIFIYSILKYIMVLIRLKMNLLAVKHFTIAFVAIIVIAVFYFKPVIVNNQVIEIAINSIIITFIFIGGNYLFKTSNEMNGIINKFLKRK